MRALVLKQFNTMSVEEHPRPEAGDGEALLAMTAVGICGSDLHGFTGENGRRTPGQVMGHEASGIVVDPGTTGLPEGRAVTFNPMLTCGACEACRAGHPQYCPNRRVIGVEPEIQAGFAEYLALPSANVVPLPEALPTEHGALIEPLAVAFNAIRRAEIEPGAYVLVTGGGPIGQSAVLAAAAASPGAVAVSEPDAGRREVCAALGAVVVDPAAGPVRDQLVERWGRPADVAVDAVGITPSVRDSLAATRSGGTVALVGMGSPTLELQAFDLSTVERRLVGCFAYTHEAFLAATAWAGEHPDLVAGLVSKEVPLDEGPQAFTDLAGPHPAPGKVLVRLDR